MILHGSADEKTGVPFEGFGSILLFHESDGGYGALIDAVISAGAKREELYELARSAHADPGPAMSAAAGVRDGAFGPRITYSRKVFIPLTKLCRDNCGYCTFAVGPRPGERAYLTPEEVLGIARAGADAGC